MSVGVQRLREEPERIRQGAIDKGEDPALVDGALALDARRRTLLAEGDTLKGERNATSKQVGEAIRGGAAPDGPEVAAMRAASVTAGQRIAAIDAELTTVEAELEDALLRIPNPADPDVPVGGEEANLTVRTWGELLGNSGSGSACSTWSVAPRSPARGSPSTPVWVRGSSARSSTGSSTST